MLPVTAKLVSVPTLVMLPCAAVVTVPAVVALVAAPLRVAVIVPALKLPLASRATMALAVFALVAVEPRVTAPVDTLAVMPPPLAKLATPVCVWSARANVVPVPTVLVPTVVGVVELACPNTNAVVATCVVLVF